MSTVLKENAALNTSSSMDFFRKVPLEVAERICGLGDHDEFSITLGCYDRMFWKYRLIDFPSAWFQASSEFLAFLWLLHGSSFYMSPIVRKWSIDSYRFSLKHLNRDGSCVEAYPFERSFCCTAFIAGNITSSMQILGKIECMPHLLRMGEFLVKNSGECVSNQVAAAALALFRLGKVTGNRDFICGAREKIQLLYRNQTPEGFFHEYGGLDLGYLSITLSLLARIEDEFSQQIDYGKINRALSLIEGLIDENGSYDPSDMIRNTQFLYPFGLLFWGSPVIGRMINGLSRGRIIRPAWLDDRYVIPLAIDYLYSTAWLERNRRYEA